MRMPSIPRRPKRIPPAHLGKDSRVRGFWLTVLLRQLPMGAYYPYT